MSLFSPHSLTVNIKKETHEIFIEIDTFHLINIIE